MTITKPETPEETTPGKKLEDRLSKIPETLKEGMKEYRKNLLEKLQKSDPDTSDKMPTTVKEALEQGWKMGPAMKLSDPPVYTFTKDGESIEIRGPRPPFFEKFSRPDDNAKGGVIRKAKGGMANKKKPAKKSKLAGRLAMRGYGAVIR
tara:strand:- start:169 stop:615 length:447 start_codon:yes stop_codon:yes gene_type:complete